jgi:hypothetical protein
MQTTLKQAAAATEKEQSMIERAMSSGKLKTKSIDNDDFLLDLTELTDPSPAVQTEAQQNQEPIKTVQEKEKERITMAIQAVEIKLLQDRVSELKDHLSRSEIRCNKLVIEKKQLISILTENKPQLKSKPETIPKKLWPSFWK